MIDGNYQLVLGGNAVGASNPLPVSPAITLTKGTTQTLFGGAIEASVAEADATVIDMRGYSGGSLEVTINSGNGTFSLAVMTHEINSGVFVQMDKEKADGSGVEDKPAIVTAASTSKSYSISGIRANYLKLVPTITGTVNATFKFTPSVF